MAVNPTSPETLNTRGWIFTAKGNADLALADLNKALGFDPQLAGAYADRGRAYELRGDRDKAIADYRKALSLKSRQTYDDKAKAEAKRRLAALGAFSVSRDEKDVTPAAQEPAKF